MNYQLIAKSLLQEQPQTMAIALARLPDEHAREILKLLPSFMQADLLSRISSCKDLPEEILSEMDDLVESLLRHGG